MYDETVFTVVKEEFNRYPDNPFSPSQIYPEFEDFAYLINKIDKNNNVYEMVRDLFMNLELDKENIGSRNWNPLKNIVRENDNVIIKPNLVLDRHPLGKDGIDSMITHASVIRPVIDYCLLASNKKCNITICDVPLQSAVWDSLIEKNGLMDLVVFYEKGGIKIRLLDLRYQISTLNESEFIIKREKMVRDPLGYAKVDLKQKSYIYDIKRDYKKLEITNYSSGSVAKHHNEKTNEYLISKTVLSADVFINIPKLKTHKKAGITLTMKNIIGINADKSWIAHHRRGVDEYPKFNFKDYFKWNFAKCLKLYMPRWVGSVVYALYQKIFLKGKKLSEDIMTSNEGSGLMEGNWYGNDTVWRTIIDLNNIIFFADKDGNMQNAQQRKYIGIIDGLIGMEKEGPMHGYPKKCGVLIGGFHPVLIDYLGAYVMGYDYNKIPTIREGMKEKYFGLTQCKIDCIRVNSSIDWKNINLKFIPTKGWKGHIER